MAIRTSTREAPRRRRDGAGRWPAHAVAARTRNFADGLKITCPLKPGLRRANETLSYRRYTIQARSGNIGGRMGQDATSENSTRNPHFSSSCHDVRGSIIRKCAARALFVLAARSKEPWNRFTTIGILSGTDLCVPRTSPASSQHPLTDANPGNCIADRFLKACLRYDRPAESMYALIRTGKSTRHARAKPS